MSEISSKESWEHPHTVIYRRVLKTIEADPPKPPADRFLVERAPALLRQTFGSAFGYSRKGTGLVCREVKEGEEVIFWNGESFESIRHSDTDFYVGDYIAFAQHVVDLAEGRDLLVVDMGAGTCMQAIALRSTGCDLPVMNLDYFELSIGRKLIDSLQLGGMSYAHVDINAALAEPAAAAALRDTILSAAQGRKVLILSRYAIHAFFTPPEYQRLFKFFLEDLGAVAGVHLEMCGAGTPTYNRMCELAGQKLGVAEKVVAAEGDTLAYLEKHPAIEVVQRQEVWPHELTTRFPSFLSWRSV